MRSWYLLYTKPREELRAKAHLENQGYEVFVPVVTLEKIRRGKRTQVQEALFPSYVFIHIDMENENSAPIRSTRGVSGFVRFGYNFPPPLPNTLIYELQRRVMTDSEELTEQLANLPKAGERVLITDGQFKNVEAIFQCPDGEQRSILLLEMLGKQVKMSLENKAYAKKE